MIKKHVGRKSIRSKKVEWEERRLHYPFYTLGKKKETRHLNSYICSSASNFFSHNLHTVRTAFLLSLWKDGEVSWFCHRLQTEILTLKIPPSLNIISLLTFSKHESLCGEFWIGTVVESLTSTAVLVLGVGRELKQKKKNNKDYRLSFTVNYFFVALLKLSCHTVNFRSWQTQMMLCHIHQIKMNFLSLNMS